MLELSQESKNVQTMSQAYFNFLSHFPSSIIPSSLENSKMNILDVGAHSWNYLPAIVLWLLERVKLPINIIGVELLGKKWLHTFCRLEREAQLRAKRWSIDSLQCSYRTGNVYSINEKQDLIFLFFPFVFLETAIKWGVPKSEFNPESLFLHIESILKKNGLVIMFNLGDLEWERVSSLFKFLKLSFYYCDRSCREPFYHSVHLSAWRYE